MAPAADHNLLFGILAWQMDFITRDVLLSAMQAWVFDKGKPLSQVLLDHGQLTAEQRQALDLLVGQHLEAHGNDPQRSLAAVPVPTLLQQQLRGVADEEMQASLAGLATVQAPEPGSTREDRTLTESAADRYRILRPHAKGGLGEVFVALDQELQREVALKEIQQQYAHELPSRTRFVREAEITGGLEHPGIVPVYGLGEYADGRPFYAMRFIQGETLKDAIDHFHETDKPGRDAGERRLALRKLLDRFTAVCNAVAFAHSRGVLHRDLKPANIMLGRYGETLLVDWGLAKPLGERPEPTRDDGERTLRPTVSTGLETQAGAVLGTPAFMSPEQAAGRSDQIGPASDIYSLGATLYTLLAGRAPFKDSDPGMLLAKVQLGEFVPPRQLKPQTPPALEAICRKAMALRPADRYATALELAADVEHWLADEPVRAYPEPWTQRTRRWVGRHRGLASGAAAAILAALISLVTATVLLTAANSRERAALNLVEQQKAQTEENFRLARQAVDEYITKVSEDPRLKEHDLEALRKNLLESALTFYQRFVESHGNEIELQAEQAKALIRLADITGSLTTRSEAIRLYEQALAIQERLAQEFPGDPTYTRDLAGTLRDLASLYAKTGRGDEAGRTVRRAVTVAEALAHDQPANDDSQRILAASYLALSGHERENKRWQPAEELLSKANHIISELAERKAATAADVLLLAGAYHNLGEYFKASGQPARAEPAFRKTLTWIDACPASADVSQDIRQLLRGLAYFNLGELQRHSGRTKEAEASFTTGRDLLREAGRKHPAVTDYQNMLAAANAALAILYQETDRPDLAEDGLREAVAVWQMLVRVDPSTTRHLANLAVGKLKLVDLFKNSGRPRQAERHLRDMIHVLEEWLRLEPGSLTARRQLAGGHTLLASNLAYLGRPQEAEQEYRQGADVWEKVVREYPEDEEVARNSAFHFMEWGELLSGGRPREALVQLGRAIEARDSWLKRHPTDLNARLVVLEMRTRRAKLYQQLKQMNEALTEQQVVVAEEERLAGQPAEQLDRRYHLASSLDYLAQLCFEAGRSSQAEAITLHEVAILEALVRKQPAAQHYQASLADAENSLGILYNNAQNQAKAEIHYRQAIAVGQKAGTDSGRRVHLGGAHCNLAHVLRRLNRMPTALAEYAEAGRILEELWTDPDLAPNLHRTTRGYLGNTYSGWLAALDQLGRSAEALAVQERLLQIDATRFGDTILFKRALTLARLGISGRATAEADALAQRPKLTGQQLYTLAATYARAGRAERAIELLNKAQSARYFADPAAVARLRHDQDFDNLRSRAEFQKLLAGLPVR